MIWRWKLPKEYANLFFFIIWKCPKKFKKGCNFTKIWLRVFSCEFCRILKSIYLVEHLQTVTCNLFEKNNPKKLKLINLIRTKQKNHVAKLNCIKALMCSINNVLWKNFYESQEKHLSQSRFFNKVTGWRQLYFRDSETTQMNNLKSN